MNPFSIGYLVFVVIAAVTLNQKWVWTITLSTLIGFTAISYLHVPIHQLMHHSETSLSLHLKGMVIAYAFTAIIVSLFLSRIVKEHSDLREQYLHMKSSLEKIARVTTVTADAVHQLRTPLATMKLIVDELSFYHGSNTKDLVGGHQLSSYDPMEDIALLSQQIERCNDLLTDMCYQNGNIHGASFSEVSIDTIWEDACSEISQDSLGLIQLCNINKTIIVPKLPLVKALRGLIINAIQAVSENREFSKRQIHLSSEVNTSHVEFTISDNGCGMDEATKSMCHHPFFTTKFNSTSLGLGLFVANTVALQLGGTLIINSTKGKGTQISLIIPKDTLCKNTF